MNSKFPLFNKFKIEFKFLLVGTWNTLFGYSVFLLFLFIFEELISIRSNSYLLAITCSHIFGIINSFFFHKYFTFGSNKKGLEALKEFFRHPQETKKFNLENNKLVDQKIIIQGFGNVGLHAAKSLFATGAKIIGIAEKKGAIFNEKGININKLKSYLKIM